MHAICEFHHEVMKTKVEHLLPEELCNSYGFHCNV